MYCEKSACMYIDVLVTFNFSGDHGMKILMCDCMMC